MRIMKRVTTGSLEELNGGKVKTKQNYYIQCFFIHIVQNAIKYNNKLRSEKQQKYLTYN